MLKVAIVHDYFTQLGGAERVAAALFEMFPKAHVFATVIDPRKLPAQLRGVEINTTWMQRLPSLDTMYRHYAPLYPLAVSSIDLSGYDLVVSSSSGFAKGVRVDPASVHVCYCHTPMRWVWRFNDYSQRENFGASQKLVLKGLLRYLRRWDLDAARQPDQFVVNSEVVAARVRQVYGRHSFVIPPPIEVDRFSVSTEQDDFYLVLSRLVAYKRVDLAIEACMRINRRLVVIGEGPDGERLRQLAGPSVTFLGRVPDDAVEHYMSRCQALLFPGEEDFGMVPLEVNAAGRPVVAFYAGGATETIIDSLNGVFFHQPTAESMAEAILALEQRSWNPHAIRMHARKYGKDVFAEKMYKLISSFVELPAKDDDVSDNWALAA